MSSYIDKAIAEEAARVAAAPAGTRNDTLFRAAANLYDLVRGGRAEESEVLYRLREAAWGNGLDPRETERTITSARDGTTGIRGPSHAQNQSSGERKAFLLIGGESSEEDLPTPLNWSELWSEQEADKWLIEPLIAVGAQTVLYSPPKMGKSLLALEIAAALANGTGELLGIALTRTWNVVYVDHENRPVADIRARLVDMGYAPEHLANLYLYSFPAMPKLDTPEGGLVMSKIARKHAADLVVIDTASRTIRGEENSNDTWVQWYANTGFLLKQQGCALLRLDHTGKDEERGQRGGSAKSSDVDMVWRMTCAVPDEVFVLNCDASRMENAERVLTLKRESGPLRHTVDSHGLQGAMEARSAAHLALLDRYEAPRDIGVQEATLFLRARGHTVTNGSITKRMLEARKVRA